MGMLLTHHDGYWPDEQPVKRAPAEPDAYDELTDEQVAEAYATNVGGNATSRKGQLKALRKLEADAEDFHAPADEQSEDDAPKDESADQTPEGADSGE